MSDDRRKQQTTRNVANVGEGYIKGAKGWHDVDGKNYQIQFPSDTTTAVSVVDKSSRATQVAQATANLNKLVKQSQGQNAARAQNALARIPAAERALHDAQTGTPRGSTVFRLDTPHRGHQYNHININPDISGVRDPHIRLPSGAIEAGTTTAKVAKVINKANKVLVPVAIAADAAQTGYAVYNDVQNETSRNTVGTVTNIAAAWGGGYGGAMAGAAAGTALFPGIGTIAGGLVGGIAGGISSAVGADYLVNSIGDAAGYDVEERICQKCGHKFLARLYEGEKDRRYCDKCKCLK